MAIGKGKLGPREELMVAGGMLLGAMVAWYLMLYHPLETQINQINEKIANERDSLAAVQLYKTQELAFGAMIEQIKVEIEDWDSRFPPRDSVVILAKQLVNFTADHGLELVDLEPSLFELYALEKAGAQISGRFVMQLPLKFVLEGRYLNFSRMMEKLDTLPFNITVADVQIVSIPDRIPQVEIAMDVYLYVHL